MFIPTQRSISAPQAPMDMIYESNEHLLSKLKLKTKKDITKNE